MRYWATSRLHVCPDGWYGTEVACSTSGQKEKLIKLFKCGGARLMNASNDDQLQFESELYSVRTLLRPT